MNFIFASRRQLSFIITVGARNLLVQFGAHNQAGVSVFMTQDERVAKVLRRHSLTRRGIIEETTRGVINDDEPIESVEALRGAEAIEPKQEVGHAEVTKTVEAGVAEVPTAEAEGSVVEPDGELSGTEAAEPTEREYDNYTVARESICKEFGVKKGEVRNPTALAAIAKEHGIVIKYKEL